MPAGRAGESASPHRLSENLQNLGFETDSLKTVTHHKLVVGQLTFLE
jgi:tRNA uridine 5-carboxymethylaminomethyl modification enzyme